MPLFFTSIACFTTRFIIITTWFILISLPLLLFICNPAILIVSSLLNKCTLYGDLTITPDVLAVHLFDCFVNRWLVLEFNKAIPSHKDHRINLTELRKHFVYLRPLPLAYSTNEYLKLLYLFIRRITLYMGAINTEIFTAFKTMHEPFWR